MDLALAHQIAIGVGFAGIGVQLLKRNGFLAENSRLVPFSRALIGGSFVNLSLFDKMPLIGAVGIFLILEGLFSSIKGDPKEEVES